MHARSAPRLLAALAGTLLLATPVDAGPPWISVEYPANPFDRATEGALAIVHTYHHGDAISFPVRGTAEGLVGGERQTIPLDLRNTSRSGVYAAFADLPDEGSWVLAVHMTDTEVDIEASILVALDDRRDLAAVRVAHSIMDGWIVPRAASAAEIEELLIATDKFATIRREVGLTRGPEVGTFRLAGFGALLLLVPIGLVAVRRRRRG